MATPIPVTRSCACIESRTIGEAVPPSGQDHHSMKVISQSATVATDPITKASMRSASILSLAEFENALIDHGFTILVLRFKKRFITVNPHLDRECVAGQHGL